jgi:uncharacterized membrane protein (UPF0127 family)
MPSPHALQQKAARAVALGLGLGIGLELLTAVALGAASAPQAVIRRAAGGTTTVTVEVAATSASRERGLMFRQELPDSHGMLFVFPQEADHAFWMRNTPLSLDIVFIGSDRRIVGIAADTVPYSERHLRVGKASRYVLEVAAGFCARESVRVGDCVEFPGVPEIVDGERPCAGAGGSAAANTP